MATAPTPIIRSQVEMISPKLAQQMLAANTQNRPLRDAATDLMAKDMAEGRWHLNGESIIFSSDGVLTDGQHRLTAVVRSGVTVPKIGRASCRERV